MSDILARITAAELVESDFATRYNAMKPAAVSDAFIVEWDDASRALRALYEERDDELATSYVSEENYPTTFAGQTPEAFFMAHCEHPWHGHLVLNSGHHYSTRDAAQRRLDEHLEEEHGVPRPDLSYFATVKLLHKNCAGCLAEAESAAIMARVTGSVAGTSETVNPEGVPDHAATVSDRITTAIRS